MTNYEKFFGTLEKATATLYRKMPCSNCPIKYTCKILNRKEELDYCYLLIEEYLKGEAKE